MSDSELDEFLNEPSFKELVDEPELLPLFTEDRRKIARAVGILIDRCLEDGDFQGRLTDALDTAIEHDCGEDEAVLWIVAILAEARSQTAIHTLMRGFSMENEESLSNAAGIALLRIGVPALEALMEWIDEEPGLDLRRQTYRLLGDCGVIEEQGYIGDIKEFLRVRIARELPREPGERALEEAIAASARLGDYEHLDNLRQIFAENFAGRNAGIQDSIESLEENPDGIPFVPTLTPWEESFGWIFEEDLENHKVSRPQEEEAPSPPHHHHHCDDEECGE